MPNAKPIGRALIFVAWNLFLGLALIEGVFLAMLHVPRVTAVSPRPVRQVVQQVYRHFNRMLIQFNSGCARYDPEVTYTLKPGMCVFGNIEFTNRYEINRLGLRDDESSLMAPEVIVLGDSHAMGWGVEQDQTLVHVLAEKSGRKTLNAAVSSYGTVRQMKMLGRLDTSRLRVLIVQYADNDLPENRTFREQGDDLAVTSEAEYQKIVRYYASQGSYYPGKYVYRLFMKVFGLEEPEPDRLVMGTITPTAEAALFLHVVTRAGRTPLDNVQLVVFEVSQQFDHPRAFIAALNEVRRHDENPEFVRRLITLDTTSTLTPADFYSLDDHMNARGHQVVGEALADLIASRNLTH